MNEQKTMRSSNLELLRIVASIMIIIYHIYQWIMDPQLTDSNLIAKWNNDFYCHTEFYLDL